MKIVSRKSEWIIFAGFVIVVVASVAEAFLPEIGAGIKTVSDYRKYVELRKSWQFVLVDVLNVFGTVVLASGLVILGLRSIRYKIEIVKSCLFLVVGLGLFSVMLASSYIPMTINYVESKPKLELLERSFKEFDYDIKTKSKLSQMYARDKYIYEGEVVEYTNETGARLRYQPTKEDLELREQDLLAKEMWSSAQKWQARRSFYSWCGITAASLFLGLFTPLRREHPTC